MRMRTHSLSRVARAATLLATAVAAVTTAVLVAPSAEADTFRGVIRTPGGVNQAVWTVEAAGSPYHAWKTIPTGTGVHILCQTGGTWENGTHGPSNMWDFLTNGGMVPHTNVDTPGVPWGQRVAEDCTFTVNPPAEGLRANPKTYHQAIDRAFRQLGSTGFEERCLAFVAEAYGWDGAGWSTAEIGGDWLQSHGYLENSGIPPRGALVWYHNSSNTGHVMLSLGEGFLIGTSVNGKVGLADNVNYRSGYRGWSIPYLPAGWGTAPW
jgi:hypothetical protein